MGGRPYEVSITYDKGRLLVSCECPYFADFGRCKHLWAAILEADRRGALGQALHAKYLQLEDESELNWDDPLKGLGRFSLHPPVPPPPPIPAWQEHLTAIQREMEQKKLPVTAWPREFEILYVIDVAASKAVGAIVIELSSRTRKKNGEWSSSKPFKVTPQQAGSLPDTADAEAVASHSAGYAPSASEQRMSRSDGVLA